MRTVTCEVKIRNQEKKVTIGGIESFLYDDKSNEYVFYRPLGYDRDGLPKYKEIRYPLKKVAYFKVSGYREHEPNEETKEAMTEALENKTTPIEYENF